MALIRWEPAAELNTIQTEMNRLFNSLFDNPTRPSTGAATRRWVPAMDLVETGDHYVLRADLPGLSEKDVNVELDSNVLTISGERKAESSQERSGYRRVERSYGSFSRSLTLPKGINAEAVEASFEHGVLEVRIPKPELVKPRKVTIAVGAGTETRDEVVEGTDGTPETSTSEAGTPETSASEANTPEATPASAA
jgi:HSP20 family protein